MKKLFLLLTLMFLWAVSSMAVTSNYSFTSSSGTYTAITGGTVIVNGTTALDSWASGSIVIPTFIFNGGAYTTAFVTSNGLLTLGGTQPGSGTTTGISTGTGVNICPFNADLDRVNTDLNTEIRMEVVGDEIVFQWQQFKRYGQTESFDFQVRLNSATGDVVFVYQLNSGPGAGTSYFPQIGIRSSATDFNNIAVAAGAETWDAPIYTGNLNTATCRFTSTAVAQSFVSGQTFMWSPTTPYPTPAADLVLTPGLTSMTLNWTDSPDESSYAVLYSLDGVTYTALASLLPQNTITYTATGLTPSTFYYWRLIAMNEAYGSALDDAKATNDPAICGNKTVGGAGTPDYASLTAAFADITANGLACNTNLIVQSGYNGTGETYPLVPPPTTSMGTYTLTIYPGASGLSITSANATGTINMNGCKNVTFDGRVNLSGSADMIIANTNVGVSPAVQFINDASNNTIQYCNIFSSANTITTGTIVFSTGITTGNDNNTIAFNKIYGGTTLPVNAIYSSGTSAAKDNSGNILNGNNIYDYFSATLVSMGINLGTTGNSAWTITNNKLFQTATRIYTTANTHDGIYVGTGSGYAINGNVIGYASGNGSGTTNLVGNSVALTGTFPTSYTSTGTINATRFVAINCAFTAGGTVSNIQGNTVAGIALYTSSGAGTANGILCGINVTSGNANIGTVTGNTIGATTGNSSLYAVNSSGGGAIVGIYATSTNTVTIQNNTIGHWDALGYTSTYSGAITGIDVAGTAGIFNISNNTIGNTTADNMRIGYTWTGTALSITGAYTSCTGTTSSIVGIRSAATGTTLSITNNTLQGWASSCTGGTVLTGFSSTGGNTTSVTINNNFLGTAGLGWMRYAFANSGALTGINLSSSTSATIHSIQNNDFRGIVYSVAGTGGHTYINFTAGSAASNVSTIAGNTFTNLNVNTTGTIYFYNHGYSEAATGTQTFNNNSIVTAFNKPGAGGTVYITYSNASSTAGSITNFTNNNFSNITVTGATAVIGFNNTDGGAPTKTFTGNTFNNWTCGTSAVTAMNVNYFGGASSVSNNIVTNITGQGAITGITIGATGTPTSFAVASNTITGLTSTGTGGAVIGLSFSTPATAANVNGNTINTFSSTTGAITGLTCSAASAGANIYSNTINTLSSAGASVTVLGLSITGATLTNVYQNTINGLSGSGITSPVAQGILVSGGTTVNVYRNKIYNISESGAISTTAPAITGLLLSGGTTVTANNNIIGDLRAPAANKDDMIRGISVTSSSATTNYNVYFNSVYLSGGGGTNFGTSGIFHTTSTTATTAKLDLRDNVIVNKCTPSGTGLVVVFRRNSGAASTLANYASTSNNNLFYTTPSTAGYYFYNDGTSNAQTMAAYKAGVFTAGTITPRDAASVSQDPTFLSTTSSDATYLHVDLVTPSQLESGGTPIAGITIDFDGDTRNVSTPDIGADEFAGTPLDLIAPAISAITNLGTSCDLVSRNVSAVIADPSGVDNVTYLPKIYYRLNGGAYTSGNGTLTSGTNISGTWTFTINYAALGGVAVGNTIDYFIVAQDLAAAGNAGGSPSVGLALTNVNTITTPPTTPLTYTILNTLSGNYNVGVGQTFTTITAAVAAYNSNCLTGPVTFNLTDLTYNAASGETFPITINVNPYASAVNTLTIKPNAAGTVITGATAASSSLIKLNGADYVIIDGSSNGTTSRDLSIINSGTTNTNTAVIWISSLGNGAGATYNTIKNTIINAGSSTVTTTFGIYAAGGSVGTGTTGSDNDYLTIDNNSLINAYYDMYLRGTSTAANYMDHLVVQNNDVTSFGIWGIHCYYNDAPVITKNNITVGASTIDNIKGIYLNYCYNGIQISKNKIDMTNTSTYSMNGITLETGTGTVSLPIYIWNNFISVQNATATGTQYGIRLYPATYCNVYANSINVLGASATDTRGINAAVGSTFVQVFNNNIKCNYFPCFYELNTVSASDNNNQFSTLNKYAYYNGSSTVTYTTMAALVADAAYLTGLTSRDANTISINPSFVSVSDLHTSILGTWQAGSIQAYVTDDIDGQARPTAPAKPCIGADEYTPPSCVTAVGGTAAGSTTSCKTATPSITASGYSAELGVTYQWYSSTNVADYPASGTIIAGQTNPAVLTLGAAVTTTTYYWLKVSCATDASNAYSTMATITILNYFITSSQGASRCGTGTLSLQATGDGTSLQWFNIPTGGSSIGSGSPWTTPSISVTTTYYVSAQIGGSSAATIGAGGSTTISTGSTEDKISPWSHYYGGFKSQYLFTAAELTAAGLNAGNINSLSFEVVTPGTSYAGFAVSMASTSATALTTSLVSTTDVYTNASLTPTAGIFTINFTTPFAWNGTSNLIVQTCWSNANGGGTGTTVKYDATSFVSQSWYRADSQTPSAICGYATGTTQSYRPKMLFTENHACVGDRVPVVASVVDAPVIIATADNPTPCAGIATNLTASSSNPDYTYTWSAGTTPTVGNPVATSPMVATTYTVNAADNTTGTYAGCMASTTVTLNPIITTISGQFNICAGTSSQLTASGTPANVDPWVSASTGVITIDGTGLMTGIASGTSVITFTDINGCQKTVTASVLGAPTPVTSTSPLCLGQSSNLNATSAPGSYILWYDAAIGGNLIGNSQSGVNFPVTPASVGTHNYFASATNVLPTATQAFNYTGSLQSFTVPLGVTSVTVKLWGAGGGTASNYTAGSGGSGGYTTGTLNVTPGDILSIMVGQGGSTAGGSAYGGGGASGGTGSGGGGGRSAILVGATEIATAAGGGGSGEYFPASLGGEGGGLTGGSGGTGSGMTAATGGTQSAGGLGGYIYSSYYGGNGSAGNGGYGSSSTIWYGGGGGGGYFGGGGGGSDEGGGGAGGSSYFGGLTGGSTVAGSTNTAGTIAAAPNNTDPGYVAGIGTGAGRLSSPNVLTGGDGLVVLSWTNLAGCETADRTEVSVSVNPIPTVTGTLSMCVNATTQLTGSGTPATTNAWVSSLPAIASVDNNGLVTGNSAGTSVITYKDDAGCTITATVTVNSLPGVFSITPSTTTVCENAIQHLTISGGATPTAATYIFSAANGTYTPLSGGNVVAGVAVDQFLSPANPIGFTFNYCGTNYTDFYMSSNGFISFTSTIGFSDGNILSTSTSPVIAPLWDDMDAAQSLGTPSYLTTGTAGHHVLTVEWLNWEWYYTANNPVISFQCKLYEYDGHIEFVYRQEANPIVSGSASIGLSGLTSGNFLSLSNSGTAPTASSTVNTTNIATKPANGQTYYFYPPNTPVTWSTPNNDLYSNASATTLYVPGTQSAEVWAKPTVTTTYTATSTNAFGCVRTESASITVNAASVAPTSISGTTTVCLGGSTTLTAVGGIEGTEATTNWYKGSCDNGFVQDWFTQPYAMQMTTVNSTTGGILDVTSDDVAPQISMFSIGSFDPAIYKYMQIRYRVISTTPNPGSISIYYTNTLHATPDPSQVVSGVINDDGDWHIMNLDMSTSTNWMNSFVTGWRFDWCSAWGPEMQFDYIKLGAGTAVAQGPSIDLTPAATANYYVSRSGFCNTTPCTEVTVTVPGNVGVPVFTLGSASTRCSKVETVDYSATATDASGIIYTLDAESLLAGNTIDASTGMVTYTAAWYGTSIITATAAGCSGPTVATHTVTINESPTAVTVTPSTQAMCSSDIQALNATGGTMSGQLTTIWDENFNGTTNSWSTTNNSTGGTPANAAWTLESDGYTYNSQAFHSNDNSQFYMSNSDAQGEGGTTATILESPVFSTVGYTAASLSFYHHFSSGDVLTASVDYSLDGINWVNLKSYDHVTIGSAGGFVQDAAILPVGQPTVYVRFKLDGDYGWYWAIDNVLVSGNTPNTPITWTPIDGLYSNTGATTAYVLNTPTYSVYAHPTTSAIYTATATALNGCITEGTAELTVTTLPVATFSYAGTPYCTLAADPLPSLDGAAGTFTAGAGLTINALSGLVSLTGSTAGTYTVTNTIDPIGGCPQVVATNSIQITTAPTATISYSGSPFCTTVSSAPVTLGGTGTYTGGAFTALPSGLSIDPVTGEINPSLSLGDNYTVTYTIPAIGGGCGPIEVTTQVTITALPIAGFSYTGTPYCANASNPLPEFVSGGAAGTFTVTPTDLIFVSNTTGEVNIAGSSAASYTITNTIAAADGCAEVTATTPFTINALPTATISYTGSPWCTSAGVQAVTQTGNLGGTYSAPLDLTIDPVTGEITPSSSLAGTYTVTYTVSVAGCAASYEATASVTITALPVATFSYTGSPYNPTGTAVPTLDGVAGVFSSTTGLVFVSTATGEVDLAASTGGTYTVTNTVAAAGGCAEVTATSSIEIIVPTTKTLTVKAFIEGLYDGGGMMHEAIDFIPATFDFPMKWGAGNADTLTVALYDDTYSTIIALYHGVYLSTDGYMSIEVSSTLVDSYYISVFPRNSVPVTTPLPQSFAGTSISYDFTLSQSQAYGSEYADPMKDLGDGNFGMYTGELSHDAPFYYIDGDDVSVLDPDIALGPYGYLETDLNGSGFVDGDDVTIMDNNSKIGPLFWSPLLFQMKSHLLIQNK